MSIAGIKVRKPAFEFPMDIRKYWYGGSALKTCFLNSFTLLFPGAESFFVKTVKRYLSELEGENRKEALAFMGQETQHSMQHIKYWENMKQQGYEIETLVSFYNWFIKEVVEKQLDETEQLALTAGLEHYTALLAEIALKGEYFEVSEPVMKKLFEWHAAEELEHKSVAYNVLKQINPDYFLRIRLMLFATIMLITFTGSYTALLLLQEKEIKYYNILMDGIELFLTREGVLFPALEIFFQYFKPNFHPTDCDNLYLTKKVFKD